MDQVKIGKFIAECRKNNNLTQMQLAEKLNITDRAISKWENGKSMPDSGIMLDLCNELKISVNELLSGEMINMKDYNKKAEENILNTISDSNKKIAKKNQLIGVIILFFGILISMLALMAFNPDSHACSFSIIIGVLCSTIGFYKITKTKSYLKNIVFVIIFFITFVGIILLFDYIGVAYNNRPPIFTKTISTGDNEIYYDAFFYDVIRYNPNKENETFEIVKN